MNEFIKDNFDEAIYSRSQALLYASWNDIAMATGFISKAVELVGRAQHPVADETSPAHSGFQVWWDINNGPKHFGSVSGWLDFVKEHSLREGANTFDAMAQPASDAVNSRMDSILKTVLAEPNE